MDGPVGRCNGNGGRVLERYIPTYQAGGEEDIVMSMRIGLSRSHSIGIWCIMDTH